MVITRKMAQRLSAGEILDELLTEQAYEDIKENIFDGTVIDKYRQVVYKGPLTLSYFCRGMNTSSGEYLEGYQQASFSAARDTSLRCAREKNAIHPDSWYLYCTVEAPDEDGFFTVQTFIETLEPFEQEHACINFNKPNDRKHLLIDALTGDEVVAYEIYYDT